MTKFSRYPLITDPFLRWFSAGTLALLAVSFVWAAATLRAGSHLIAIHTTAAGPDFFGTRADAFNVPAIGTAIVIINLFLITAFARRLPTVARILACLNVWFAILLLISVGSIIAAN